jgi:hypothetical protein
LLANLSLTLTTVLSFFVICALKEELHLLLSCVSLARMTVSGAYRVDIGTHVTESVASLSGASPSRTNLDGASMGPQW